MSDKPIPERVSIIETKVDTIENDITGIKNDISGLKNGQAETNSDIREITVLLRESYNSFKEIVKQNSGVITELGKKLDESNKVNDERYIDLIKDKNKNMQVSKDTADEGKSKGDQFKDFAYKLGVDILKLAIAGGLIFYVLNISKVLKL